jgi:hypothetical protein
MFFPLSNPWDQALVMVANSFLQQKVKHEYLLGRSIIKIKQSLYKVNTVTNILQAPSNQDFLQKKFTGTNLTFSMG